jgi:hypothetical protein
MSSTPPQILRRHRNTLTGAVAAVAVAGVLAGCGSSSSSTQSTASPTPAAATSASPQGVPPGMGTTVTGAAAAKAKAAATAKYPGTVERVVQLPDGSYEVHVVTKSGEVHVKVSKDFQVTGTETGPPAGATPPAGSAPPSSNGTGTTTQSS